MGILSGILMVLFVIVSLLLIFIVAIQDEESNGLGGIFADAGNQAWGSRVGSVVNRTTAVLGGAFIVLALLVAVLNKTPKTSTLLEQVGQDQVQQTSEWWNEAPAAETETAPAPDSAEAAPAASN